MKSYTDIEQSKKLAKILPLETTDMFLALNGIVPIMSKYIDEGLVTADETAIPCWSLAALLEQLPYELCDDDGNSVYLQIDKEDDLYQLIYEDPHGYFESIETDRYGHFVDACYELILKLHELNLL